jgi:hypothetical protein
VHPEEALEEHGTVHFLSLENDTRWKTEATSFAYICQHCDVEGKKRERETAEHQTAVGTEQESWPTVKSPAEIVFGGGGVKLIKYS